MSDVISGLMHLSLRVKDYEKSLDFYCNGMGFEKMFEYTKKDFYELDPSQAPKESRGDENNIWLAYLRIRPRQYLELFPVPHEEVAQHTTQSFFHFSLQVDNIEKTVDVIRKRGIKIYKFGSDIARNKQVPKIFVPLVGKCRSRIAWTCDPDGNMIELMELTPQSHQRRFDEANAYKFNPVF